MEEDWNDTFYDLFREAVGRYHEGHRNVDGFFTDQEIIFLSSIGCRTRELFDFVETYARTGRSGRSPGVPPPSAEPWWGKVLPYGQFYQGKPVIGYDLPGFGDELCGLPYLPRLIAKARAKLVGSMGDDIIYCCENDRRFFRDHGNIHPADFLRVVWAAGDSDPKVYDYVRQRTLSVSSAVPDNEQM